MAQEQDEGSRGVDSSERGPLSFLLDTNLGLDVSAKRWKDALSAANVTVEKSTDLVYVDRLMAEHKPDIAYIPVGSFHRLFGKGDHHYRGLAQATSKLTGEVLQTCFLVVGRDDPANSIGDLSGAKFGFINRSCSSNFLEMTPVTPGPTWQGLIDAVISGDVRATMVLEDTWTTQPRNAENTKIIERYTRAPEAVVVVRNGVDTGVCKIILDALVATVPNWDTVYGSFKPFYYADVHAFFHDLDQLPSGL